MANPNPATLNEINYIRTGKQDGETVVFLHVVGLDLTIWSQQIEALRHEFNVIAFDFPNHGLSQPLKAEPTFDQFADSVIQLIETLLTGPVHLIGISFGGMVAQVVAIKRPELVRSLCLIGTSCTFPDQVRLILKDRAAFVREEGIKALAPISLERWFAKDFHRERR